MNYKKEVRKRYVKKILGKISLLIPNDFYIKINYYLKLGKWIDLNNPKTFNEKLQYLKLNQEGEYFSNLVDKIKVRDFIKNKIDEDILTKILWIGTSPDNIPYEALPNKFVIKCNHGSGYNYVVTDKDKINEKKISKIIKLWLEEDYWIIKREMQYKGIEKKVYIEEFLEDKIEPKLLDYRFFCFNGNPTFITVDREILDKESTCRNLYDLDWNNLHQGLKYKNFTGEVRKPVNLSKMIEYSRLLSENLPMSRIDFYEINGKVFFGEITFTHGGGTHKFRPDHEKLDIYYGNMIKI